jgi:lipopolysaccharide export system permease protein
MLFQSSIRKELARSFGATFVVLLTIVMTMTLFRVLGLTTKGGVNPADLMVVMWYTVLGQLGTILALSLAIAIVSTVSRMYRDSEMVIWFASGQGLGGFISPTLRFAWPVLLVIAAMTLIVSPWSYQQSQDMKERFEKRGDLERVTPGQFQESAGGNRVFFIDKASSGAKTGKNIFIAANDKGKEAITSAQSGRIEVLTEGKFLVLNNGQRLENTVGDPRLKVSAFASYGTKLSTAAAYEPGLLPVAARTTLSLINTPTPENLGQLAWRVGLVLAAVNFVGLALAAATSNPRAGRSGNMLFAAFAFFLVFQLLNLGQSWISSGKSSFTGFTLGLHGSTFALVWLWIGKLHFNWSWRYLLPVQRPAEVIKREA